MIEDYFSTLESVLKEFPTIQSYELTKKIYNIHQGYVRGKVLFESGHILEFMEVVDGEQTGKVKYRYHFMDGSQKLLFRYDNSPHHTGMDSFPHHQHKANGILPSQEPDLRAVLYEISESVKS